MKSNPTVDPNAAGPGVVAAQEWDLTSSLPQVTANTANASQAATRTAQHRPLTAPRAPTELPGSLRGPGQFASIWDSVRSIRDTPRIVAERPRRAAFYPTVRPRTVRRRPSADR